MAWFNSLKLKAGRLPRPLIGLALLAVSLAAGVGATAKHAEASSTTPYTVEITWNRVKWSYIDDGFANFDFELYGTLQAANLNTGASSVRMIGDVGNPGRCHSSEWDGAGQCNKTVGTGLSYYFNDTPLSANTASGQPGINYAFNNNKMYLTVYPGQTIWLSAQLYDYDATSANDKACIATAQYTLSEAQLTGLDYTTPVPYSDSDAKCFVEFRLKRV